MGESVLLLVTILLVLIAAVTLLIGIFGDNLAFIFVSIGSSIVAALVLGVLSQMSKRQTAAAVAGAPAGGTPTGAEPSLTPEPVASTAALDETVAAAGTTTSSTTAVAALPIADYDALRVNDVIPRLEGLDLDQLEAIAQHEEAGKNRSSILNRIDQLMDELEAAEAPAPATEVAEPVAAAVDEAGAAAFPIPEYESLGEDQVIALLGDLDADELETVAEFEETHANRDRVLDAIDDRLDELEGIAPAATAGATTATATKAAATKAVKKATTAAKATKAAAKKTAVKKAGTAAKATKSTTKASAAPPRKAATPAKRATSAAKATVKKAAKAATTKKAGTATKAGATKKAAAAKKTAKR